MGLVIALWAALVVGIVALIVVAIVTDPGDFLE